MFSKKYNITEEKCSNDPNYIKKTYYFGRLICPKCNYKVCGHSRQVQRIRLDSSELKKEPNYYKLQDECFQYIDNVLRSKSSLICLKITDNQEISSSI